MVNHNTLYCNLRRKNKLIPSRSMTILFFSLNFTHSYLNTRLEQSFNRGIIRNINKRHQNQVVNSDVVPSRKYFHCHENKFTYKNGLCPSCVNRYLFFFSNNCT